MKHSATIKKLAAQMETISDEERKGLQKIIQYYGNASDEGRKALSHFVEVSKYAREAKVDRASADTKGRTS